MRLRCEIDNCVNLFRAKHVVDQVRRADVALDEPVVRRVGNIVDVLQRCAVVELVEVHNLVLRIFVHKETHDMRGTASHTSTQRLSRLSRRPTVMPYCTNSSKTVQDTAKSEYTHEACSSGDHNYTLIFSGSTDGRGKGHGERIVICAAITDETDNAI